MFIAHHLFDPSAREHNARHGMPERVINRLAQEGRLKAPPPHTPASVRRRISHWKRLHLARGAGHPFDGASVRAALKAAARSSDHVARRKSAKPITRVVLQKMIATCDTSRLAGRRDRALLLVAFGSGGRRRSEISGLLGSKPKSLLVGWAER
jgi:hypothetical protein